MIQGCSTYTVRTFCYFPCLFLYFRFAFCGGRGTGSGTGGGGSGRVLVFSSLFFGSFWMLSEVNQEVRFQGAPEDAGRRQEPR
jgi:hypothetical protein